MVPTIWPVLVRGWTASTSAWPIRFMMWLPLDNAERAKSSALLATAPSSCVSSLKVNPGALTAPVPALTWSKTYPMTFWIDAEDDANGPVKGPISVTVMVFGGPWVVGAAAVVADPAAVVAAPAAVVDEELLLLELHAATVARPAASSATLTLVRVRYLPSGIVDIVLLVSMDRAQLWVTVRRPEGVASCTREHLRRSPGAAACATRLVSSPRIGTPGRTEAASDLGREA